MKKEEYKLAMNMLKDRKNIQNMKEGYRLIKKLANEGYDFAQYVLGVLYYDETKIIKWTFSTDIFEKDTGEAVYWLEVYCKNKNPRCVDEAQAILTKIKKHLTNHPNQP